MRADAGRVGRNRAKPDRRAPMRHDSAPGRGTDREAQLQLFAFLIGARQNRLGEDVSLHRFFQRGLVGAP